MSAPRRCYIVAARTSTAGARRGSSAEDHASDGAPPLSRKLGRYLTDISVAAARIALADAPPPGRVPPERIGLYTATGPSRYDLATLGAKLADLDGGVDGSGPLWRAASGGLADLDPFALLKLMSCNLLAVLAMALPAEGASEHLCDDALGGLAALGGARDAIARGAVDHAVVAAFDDLTSDHACAELAASDCEGEPRQIAVLHLSADPEGALAELGVVTLTHGEGEGPVGGAAGLAVVAEVLPTLRDHTRLAIEVDGGLALVELLPASTIARGVER